MSFVIELIYVPDRSRDVAGFVRVDEKESPVVAFCSNFFLQFFANVLASAKARAIDVRLKLKGHDAERQLIFQFERLVDLWPDILGAGYGGSESDYLDFHTRYVPRLLERITAWARTSESLRRAPGARDFRTFGSTRAHPNGASSMCGAKEAQ